jgi:type III restriction enzyme
MKFTLKDYQDEAVREVLGRLRKARKRWREDDEKNAFSLTAPTGAGKTVMAAAVFEALFHGSDDYEFDADRGAVVIWFSDNPSLNEQTRFRLMESSDRLRSTDMVVVEPPFSRARFEPGKIYFLNTQKLGRNSLLVRGFEGDGGLFPESRPDAQAFTLWDTIRTTIEDPDLTLYLVLDEAHRGMGTPTAAAQNEKSTLVKRLINGERGVPGIPVVWGISATVERFNTAMQGAVGRSTLPPVSVDSRRVQDSGLLKDSIALDIPDEAGNFDTVLAKRAADKLRESSEAWAQYARQQDTIEPVVPLLVMQVEDKPTPASIAHRLDAIFGQWPELPENCVAHVFGEHKEEKFGRYTVPYISPERAQDETWVRVLIAKNAISTGWDCPRAEVMLSFRAAQDQTHIAQLLGRMVRTPLARRIPGNDRLNGVSCLLPKFDRDTVDAVVAALQSGDELKATFGRVLVNPVELRPNPDVPAAVWEKFVSLPSQMRPQRGAKPAVRLTALAHELVSDDLLAGAGKKAHAHMHAWLDAFIRAREGAFREKREAVRTVEGRTIIAGLLTGEARDETFTEEADAAVWNDAYRLAARSLSPDIARTYTEMRARRMEGVDFEDALIEAREDIAALGLLDNLQVLYDAEAKKLSDAWLAEYREQIKQLPDDRQEAYRQITALSREAQDVDLSRPVSRMEATAAREKNGDETKFPTYKQHLLCDGQGDYPVELDGWEKAVLKAEMQRAGFKYWYRNPDRPTQDSLGVAYLDGDETKIVRPDFLFFAELPDGKIAVDIVDPHGFHLADALPKLRGLARYVEAHAQIYRRIEAVAESGGKLRALDLTRADVREAVMVAPSAKALYDSAAASDYA